jgi:hypothetical protein
MAIAKGVAADATATVAATDATPAKAANARNAVSKRHDFRPNATRPKPKAATAAHAMVATNRVSQKRPASRGRRVNRVRRANPRSRENRARPAATQAARKTPCRQRRLSMKTVKPPARTVKLAADAGLAVAAVAVVAAKKAVRQKPL